MIEIILPELNLKITIHIESITPPLPPAAATMEPEVETQQLTYCHERYHDAAA